MIEIEQLETALSAYAPAVRPPRLAATVSYGRTTTYGTLATALGRPTAARAVGAVLGANPLCVVLPCHRVIAASGALSGYAGGLEAKRRLLALEASPSV
jgi:methylated-DNA-[protein]-cysteine S-methyltransferase